MAYQINYDLLGQWGHTGLVALKGRLEKLNSISSDKTFTIYCQNVIKIWKEVFPQKLGKTNEFKQILEKAKNDCPTPWGGVFHVKKDGNHIEKYLAVEAGKHLPLETHKLKHERLLVKEGTGFILYRPEIVGTGKLTGKELLPPEELSFAPGYEHCVIATEDLLLYEISEDPEGDKDLVFIYQAK